MVNRYAPDWVFGYFHRDTDGHYVLFEDHEEEVNELKSELDALREQVKTAKLDGVNDFANDVCGDCLSSFQRMLSREAISYINRLSNPTSQSSKD